MSIPHLDYRNPKDAASSKRTMTFGQIVTVVLILVLLISILLPSMGKARETAQRVKCASNLKQIGQAALLYSNENRNRYPPDVGVLLATQDLVPEVFTCPSCEIDKATGATTQAVIDELLKGDHLSYAWVGGGLTNNVPVDVVLAFDLELHPIKDQARATGINVLLGDGHVEFVDEATAKAVHAQFAAGVRPIRLPGPPSTNPAAP